MSEAITETLNSGGLDHSTSETEGNSQEGTRNDHDIGFSLGDDIQIVQES